MAPQVLLCEPGDEAEMANIYISAFANSINRRLMYRNASPEDLQRHIQRQMEQLLARQSSAPSGEVNYLKAVDPDTNETMGLAGWIHLRHGYKREEDWQARAPPGLVGANYEHMEEFAGKTADSREKYPARLTDSHWRKFNITRVLTMYFT